ncbi:regulatory protein viviparous-1-like [Dendrobium catenatum]|uniref:regulatory protein viviparous-1-like n=1 Tax=Dendrobium catenatum TaxID=906689 RepID=UPI0010A08F3C|nr:regulatory protein viviparous-1-like [Dendrobium catenatum]
MEEALDVPWPRFAGVDVASGLGSSGFGREIKWKVFGYSGWGLVWFEARLFWIEVSGLLVLSEVCIFDLPFLDRDAGVAMWFKGIFVFMFFRFPSRSILSFLQGCGGRCPISTARRMGGSVEGERELDGEASSYNDNKVVFAGEEENQTPPPSPMPDMLIDLDETAENLFFSDENDAFPSLADFPCLSSPSASPSLSSAISTHHNTVPYFSIKSSSTTSSETGPMQPPPPTMQASAATSEDPLIPIDAGFDIVEDETDIWENCTEERTESIWEPSSSFSGETATEEKTGFLCGGDDCSSEDLANVFLDWLKRNKDSISPEDLRSIKLKRSTIECAARRLGGGKQGRVQLLKLILAWVQNHHLQKRRRRSRGSETIGRRDQEFYNYPPPPPPISSSLPFPQGAANSNPNNIDLYHEAVPCNSWMPYTGEPSFQPTMPGYTSEAVPPNYYYNDQANFSAEPWQQGLSPAAVHYSPFGQTPRPPPVAAHFFPVYYPGLMASATKEARKKRMARHRRSSSSLHQHRSQQQEQQNQQQHSSDTMVVGEEITSSAHSNVNKDNSSNWPFLSSLPAPDIPSLSPGVPTPSSATMAQTQQENHLHRHASSAGDRRLEGMKAEKNYKFLLQKVLKQSDVGNLGRIVLPKKEAEINLPELDARDGISIEMEDIGTSRVWNMRYRFWPNNKSRMYLLENTGDFVRSNGLQEGDFIVIYSDIKCGKYMIRGVKVRQPVEMIKGTSNHNSRKATHQKKEKNNSTMAVDDKGVITCIYQLSLMDGRHDYDVWLVESMVAKGVHSNSHGDGVVNVMYFL